jgi:hypothetical protein
LPGSQRRRFAEDGLTPELEDDLTEVYRRWRAEED